ncbi:helix-turn-helix domain-containing protein [Nocardia sp. alder85J]|uniref:helix-turn-helix domain-containing protein n=1 Tax=Nocardia sp. alder85J TaxID=2862949 RepID=UPI001CD464C4|nr:helix-turn-helix domain-containing protein [Nocardia sp. alder85J]MCX4097941.1 helix-turn-helix domain-containing protein [Nocardia sp. alder85J]
MSRRSTAAARAPHPGPAHPVAPDIHHARAHVFFWCVLTTAAGVSVTGNAVHAVLHAHTLPGLAAGVAVVPPIALIAAVHGVTVLLRTHTRSRGVHIVATFMTVLIAGGAFWLSFTALRALAILAAVPAGQAWLWPTIIEGSMTQATVAILALAQTTRVHEPDTEQRTLDPSRSTSGESRAHNEIGTGVAHTESTDAGPPVPRRDWTHIATTICDRDPARRRNPDDVARMLAWHYDDGLTPSAIARRAGRSRSGVSRILRLAATLTDHTAATEQPPRPRSMDAPPPAHRDPAPAARESNSCATTSGRLPVTAEKVVGPPRPDPVQ